MWSVRTEEQLAITLPPYVRVLAIMAQASPQGDVERGP
jgi:hypothetical protein